ncbi:MAG: sulfatase [Kiritimatiellae bacterium]|nr:sulfatase [Kiritimatiellia bacterium]
MNIIFIVVDTLRYDYIRAHGANDWIQTPNIDRLCGTSWLFDHAYTASYPTIPHRTDALTGAYGNPFHTWMPLPWHWRTFPRALAEAGYCTQLIHDTPHLVNGGHNFDTPYQGWTPIRGAEVDRPWVDALSDWPPNWGHDPLFDFIEKEAIYKSHVTYPYLRANRKRRADEDWNAAKLFLTACEFLRDNASRENFLLHIDCFDPHEPWDAPPDFVRLYDQTPDFDGRIDPRSFLHGHTRGGQVPEAAVNRIKACYAAKVSWVDKWVGRVLDTLEETGLAGKTAVLLTADHGTNVGERGLFGKKSPVKEQEGHVPFVVHVPGAGSGRSAVIVQPQDIFATLLGIAGVPAPDDLDSHDVLAAAQAGQDGCREVALSGAAASPRWGEAKQAVLFTVFDREWYLGWTRQPEHCTLTRYGALEDSAAQQPEVVQRLHKAGLDEIARRGIDPKLLAWLRNAGETEFPTGCTFFRGGARPKGYESYWSWYYHKP